MKKLNSILITLLLAAVISAQSAQIVPIVELSVGGVIGGVKNGRWVKDKETALTLKGNDKYLLIGWNNFERNNLITGGKPETGAPCEEFYNVEFESKNDSGVALGSAVKWNPVPRRPVEISSTDTAYKKIVGDIVRSKGIARPVAKIAQAYHIDLEGDGTEEVIIAATYYKSGQVSPNAAAGDYSFLMLRKLVSGKVQNIMLAGEFYKKAVKFGAQNEYGISSIADLNGDGKMEIIMKSRYYEGSGSSVYEINGAKAIEVLTTGCGA